MQKVNVALKLTPTQVQHAIARTEQGLQLLGRLQSTLTGRKFTPTELALLLDFLPADAVDLSESC